MRADRDARLLDSIYAGAWDPGALDEALHGLAKACRSRSAGLFQLRGGGLAWEQGCNMPANFMRDFVAREVPHDPRVAFSLANPPLTVMRDDEPGLRRAMQETGVDRFARAHDLPYTVSCIIDRPAEDDVLALYVSRSAREGRPDTEQFKSFAHYASHFARSLSLCRRLRSEVATMPRPENGAATPTPRQGEVLVLLAQGLMSKQIGERLGITENTVRNHVHALLTLFQAPTRTACVARARQLGLLATL